ncbi:MAG: tRNA (cytidine(56)-2'-O)-methyltransferase [Candidatus ainarchaeum sp.]|nr:tRNA (cytidine(56)-2'-O)-methyltransferase [Candidatus ainarchaeum sp.]MDD5096519.1 tRNA (cytidine(56)-2'-O)-methyltransferase [Candidatus ainarchaeum sp.]
MQIGVLRLGHRLPRDERMTTHVCLTSRAFGAEGAIYSGQKDGSLERSVKRIADNWGGEFSIEYEPKPIARIERMKKDGWAVVHLTMYGMPLPEKMPGIAEKKKVLVVVGAEKVPAEVYRLADFNIAIGNQPHSEIAALAITLDRMQGGKELERGFQSNFGGAAISLEPAEKGKNIRKGYR